MKIIKNPDSFKSFEQFKTFKRPSSERIYVLKSKNNFEINAVVSLNRGEQLAQKFLKIFKVDYLQKKLKDRSIKVISNFKASEFQREKLPTHLLSSFIINRVNLKAGASRTLKYFFTEEQLLSVITKFKNKMDKEVFDLLHLEWPTPFIPFGYLNPGPERDPEKVIFLLKYALLSHDEFNSLKLTQITENNKSTIRFINDRINLKKADVFQGNLPENPSDLTLAQLSSLNEKQLSEYLKNKDLSHLSSGQLQVLFDQERKNSVASLSMQQVNSILGKKWNNLKWLLSDEHFKQLDVSKLSSSQISNLLLFGGLNERFVYTVPEEGKRRFSLLSVDQAQSIFDNLNSFYHIYVMPHLSNEHLKNLDLSKFDQYFAFLTEEQIDLLTKK